MRILLFPQAAQFLPQPAVANTGFGQPLREIFLLKVRMPRGGGKGADVGEKIDLMLLEEGTEFFYRPRRMADGPDCHSAISLAEILQVILFPGSLIRRTVNTTHRCVYSGAPTAEAS